MEVSFKLGGENVTKEETFGFGEQQKQSPEKSFLRRCSCFHESKGFGRAPISCPLFQFNSASPTGECWPFPELPQPSAVSPDFHSNVVVSAGESSFIILFRFLLKALV